MGVEVIAGVVVALAGAIGVLIDSTARSAKLRAEVEKIRRELRPNGGGSTRDAIGRTEQETKAQTQILTDLRDSLANLSTEVRRLAQVDVDDRQRALEDHRLIWRAINNRNHSRGRNQR